MEVIYKSPSEMNFPLEGTTFEIETVKLCPRTDIHNNVVEKKTIVPLREDVSVEGKLFFVKNYVEKRTLILLSMSPDIINMKITLRDYSVTAEPNGFPFAYGFCRLGDEEKEVRTFLLDQTNDAGIFSLVNNWGDLNMGNNINYDFYRKEIDTASVLGVDVVQIDDGWQCGSTLDTRIFKEDGAYTYYHDFYDGFWEVDRSKFPQGLTPIIEYAKEKNVTLGLWFAPDSKDCFKHYDRDMNVLRQAYSEGFKYFKLDMVVIKTVEDDEKFVKMLKEISEIGEDVRIQIDVTGCITRLGYFRGFEYGKIFVENRFCDRRGYYPHLTLKNLWKLAHYYPAQSMQFEVPNRKTAMDAYKETDPLAPIKFSSDYLFASVMVSNPLIWMEVQNLAPEDVDDISRIVEIWKKHRAYLCTTDIQPIGDEPNGSSLTGFLCVGKQYGYIIALREISDKEDFVIKLPFQAEKLQKIATSEGVMVECHNSTATIHFTDDRQYAFCRFEKM